MATHRISRQVLKSTVAMVRRCGGSRTHAAAELGIGRTTLGSRLEMAARVGFKIPPPMSGAGSVPKGEAKPDRLKQANQEIQAVRKEVVVLQGHLARARAARAKLAPMARPTKRSGRDDTLRVIFPDLHGVFQEPQAVAAFMADVKKLAPQEVIGLGDLTDCGGFLAQHHVWGYVAEAEYTFEDDIAMSNQFLDALQAASPGSVIDLIEGNHDHRVEQWCVTSALRSKRDASFLLQHYSPRTLLRLKERGVTYHSRSELSDGLPVPGAIRRGKCVFTHEARMSTIQRWGLNVVHGHDHKTTANVIHTVANGTIGVWSAGCLSKRQPLWRHGDPTGWTHSYMVQVVARSGRFLTLQVPLIDGQSLLPTLKLG